MSAWNKVKDNRGCAGTDCVTIEDFEKDLDGNLNILQEELDIGNYCPLPVLRIYIDKEDGGKRSIGIPAVRDRIVQQVLLSNMSPIFEKEFLDCSFAYRPGRSALIAIDRTEALIRKGDEWDLWLYPTIFQMTEREIKWQTCSWITEPGCNIVFLRC